VRIPNGGGAFGRGFGAEMQVDARIGSESNGRTQTAPGSRVGAGAANECGRSRKRSEALTRVESGDATRSDRTQRFFFPDPRPGDRAGKAGDGCSGCRRGGCTNPRSGRSGTRRGSGNKTRTGEFCRKSLRPQAGAPTEFACLSPKVRQPHGGRACRRARLVPAWMQMGVEMKRIMGCKPAGSWIAGSPRPRLSSCGSASVWLGCGIAVALATDDGVLALALARVPGRAWVGLASPMDGWRRRRLRPGRISAERPSRDLISAAWTARAATASRCHGSSNAESHPQRKNLNSGFVFSSFLRLKSCVRIE
jgi:hypothetical protein